jgi:hypothetical protein
MREIIESRLHDFNIVQAIIFDICRNESADVADTIATIAWCLGQNINNWVWNEIKDTVKDVAMRAIHMIGEWRDVNRMQHNSNNIVVASAELHDSGTVITGVQDVSHGTYLLRWQKPQFGWWKCNVNASCWNKRGSDMTQLSFDDNKGINIQ